jgi:peptidoglycan/LPS O-acetylase OafA/YrhL
VKKTEQARHSLIALDLMRGLAAFMVLITHVRGDLFVPYGELLVSQHGFAAMLFFGTTRLSQEAVIVFFVLSGFLVGGQVISRVRNGSFDIRSYAIDRTTRVYIPLIPACIVAAVIDQLFFHRTPNVVQVVGNMVGLNEILVPSLAANLVLWSLAYEIWFYVLAGAVGYIVTRRPNLASLAVLAVCAVVFSLLKIEYLLFWLLGAGASVATGVRFKAALLVLGTCLAAVGTVSYELAADSKSLVPVAYMPPMAAEFLVCLGIAMMLPFFASAPVNRSLSGIRNFAVAVSGFSYTLYLFHRPIDAALGTIIARADVISAQSLSIFLLRLVICLMGAVIFYYCFERHTAAARRYLSVVMTKRTSPT